MIKDGTTTTTTTATVTNQKYSGRNEGQIEVRQC